MSAGAGSAAIETLELIQCPGLFIFSVLICPVAPGPSNDVMPDFDSTGCEQLA